jgi:hypothetical protein
VKAEQSDGIFRAFKPKEDNPDSYAPEFYGYVHCEVALGSLMKYTDKAMDTTTEPGIFLEEITRVPCRLRYHDIHRIDALYRILITT